MCGGVLLISMSETILLMMGTGVMFITACWILCWNLVFLFTFVCVFYKLTMMGLHIISSVVYF